MSECITDRQGVCICGDPMRQRIAELEREVLESFLAVGTARDMALEEAAKAADGWRCSDCHSERIAGAIRALKEKP